jgi:hypothetical protein
MWLLMLWIVARVHESVLSIAAQVAALSNLSVSPLEAKAYSAINMMAAATRLETEIRITKPNKGLAPEMARRSGLSVMVGVIFSSFELNLAEGAIMALAFLQCA